VRENDQRETDSQRSSGSGWVVPVDAGAIAEALIQIMLTPEERRGRGRNAARCVVDRFESGRVAQLMTTAYRDIISGSRSTECMWDCICPTL
jgi:glycosyltransferase involved in cell wall biosynthesis